MDGDRVQEARVGPKLVLDNSSSVIGRLLDDKVTISRLETELLKLQMEMPRKFPEEFDAKMVIAALDKVVAKHWEVTHCDPKDPGSITRTFSVVGSMKRVSIGFVQDLVRLYRPPSISRSDWSDEDVLFHLHATCRIVGGFITPRRRRVGNS